MNTLKLTDNELELVQIHFERLLNDTHHNLESLKDLKAIWNEETDRTMNELGRHHYQLLNLAENILKEVKRVQAENK